MYSVAVHNAAFYIVFGFSDSGTDSGCLGFEIQDAFLFKSHRISAFDSKPLFKTGCGALN